MLGAGDEYVNTPGGGAVSSYSQPARKRRRGREKKKITLMGSKQETGVWEGLKNLSAQCLLFKSCERSLNWMWKRHIVARWILIRAPKRKKEKQSLESNSFFIPFSVFIERGITWEGGGGRRAIYRHKTMTRRLRGRDHRISRRLLCIEEAFQALSEMTVHSLKAETWNESAQKRLISCAETDLKVPINMHQLIGSEASRRPWIHLSIWVIKM